MDRAEMVKRLSEEGIAAFEPLGWWIGGFEYAIATEDGVAVINAGVGFAGVEGPVKLAELDPDDEDNDQLIAALREHGAEPDQALYYFNMYEDRPGWGFEFAATAEAAERAVVEASRDLAIDWTRWADMPDEDLRKWYAVVFPGELETGSQPGDGASTEG